MILCLLLCLIFTLTERVASEGCHFGYIGAHGEDHWGDDYSQCLGKHQSPIDIDSEHVLHTILPPLKMNGFDAALSAKLTNNGHTAMMTIDSDEKPTICGGPLNVEYEFAQLHFHWGVNDSVGSEDEFNKNRYPMESHLVFFKKEYLDFNSALSFSDGLCVLGCLFEIQDNDNDDFNSLSNMLPQIVEPDCVCQCNKPIALFDLMPTVLTSYYTYNGSLTTPPCSEVVTWIDFENTVKISHSQFELFRNLVDSEGDSMVNNFRAVQPLGDRTVLYSTVGIDDCSLYRKVKRTILKVADSLFNIFRLL